MTNIRAVVVLCGLCLAAVALTPPAKPTPAPAGVVVEEAEPGGAAAKAGLRRGDVLRSWSGSAAPPARTGSSTGDLGTPFEPLACRDRTRTSGERPAGRVAPGPGTDGRDAAAELENDDAAAASDSDSRGLHRR